jgi:MFS transporter, PHS family, inorganic phosphate transporter
MAHSQLPEVAAVLAALLTSAIGAVVFGHVADKLGRRKIYGYEVLVLAVGAIATAFAPASGG